ncbi:MAG: DUF4189 domain-containing protein [Pseudomonadota bacterium]
MNKIIFSMLAVSVLLFGSDITIADSGSKAGNRQSPLYAAIAYSKKTGSYGYSTKQTSKAKAIRIAKRECSKHARDCRPAAHTRLACVSLATDAGGGWGGHFGNDKKMASSNAIKKCSSYKHNTDCKTLITICQ